MHEKLVSVGVIAPKLAVEQVSKALLDNPSFEVLPIEGLEKHEGNPYEELLKLLQSLYSFVGEVPKPDPEKVKLPVVLDTDEVEDFTRRIRSAMEEIDAKEKEIEVEIKEIERELEVLAVLSSLEIPLNWMRVTTFTRFLLAKTHPSFYERLRDSFKSSDVCLGELMASKDQVYFAVIFQADYEEGVKEALKNSSATILEIPDSSELPLERLQLLHDRRKILELRVQELELRKRELFYENARFVKRYYDEVFVLKHVHDFMKKVGFTQEFFVMKGWATHKGLKILKSFQNEGKLVLFENVDVECVPPTLLRNPAFIRPFEMLTKMYGVPRGDEIDPTPIIAILFLFFYGMMFGDIGHGLVIAILSWLLHRKTHSDLWYIMSLSGLSSAVFGFMYGSFFGFEVIKPLFARPMENIFLFLTLSIVIGAFLIIFGMILNLYNRLRRKEKLQAIFDPNGIAGLGLYTFVVSDLFWGIAYRKPLIPYSVLLIIAMVFVFMMFLYEVLFGEGSMAERIILGIFETFDKLIAFFSNTLSFIRLGAFAVNHAGLFLAFYTMAKMSSSPWGKFISLFLGNLLLIFLEGLVVFIQAIRLEFYEFFSKFYSGDGREFKPVSYEWEVR